MWGSIYEAKWLEKVKYILLNIYINSGGFAKCYEITNLETKKL